MIAALCKRADDIAIEAATGEEKPSPRLTELLGQKEALETLLKSYNSPGVRADLQTVEIEIRSLQAQKSQVQVDEEMRLILSEKLTNPETWWQLDELERRTLYRDLVDYVVCRGRDIEKVVLKI